MNKQILSIFYVVLCLTELVHAQGVPPPPGGAPGGFPIPGIVYALLVAVGYGVYKHFNKSKK